MTIGLKIRRALLSVSDKDGIVELGRALSAAGAELIATGRTAVVLQEAGLAITPIERVSGCPEAFQGRMKTLSFPVFSGILHRRGDSPAALKDLEDLRKLGLGSIDCVVVNFYPFERTAARPGISRPELIEEIDIGGPSLVRAAAKNAPDVLVLTSPMQYGDAISQLKGSGQVTSDFATRCASEAWDHVFDYDRAISGKLGARASGQLQLRYGENPHQKAFLEIDSASPIAWPRNPGEQLTPTELSYNNILDISAAYGLASDLHELAGGVTGGAAGVVIVKHGNPCGTALIPGRNQQLEALKRAWEGDPVSAFGGIVMFTDPLSDEAAEWLSSRFVEAVVAPGLAKDTPALKRLLAKRKNLKAVGIHRYGGVPAELSVTVPGGRLCQTADTGLSDPLKSVTRVQFPEAKARLARFGIAMVRTLKSNAVAIVREIPAISGSLQLIGGGQGQPNRIEAFQWLAVPRARKVLATELGPGQMDPSDPAVTKALGDCVFASDAFFPFRDTVDAARAAGLRWIVQPGGSVKDAESIAACDEHGIGMAFTGIRHFKH